MPGYLVFTVGHRDCGGDKVPQSQAGSSQDGRDRIASAKW